MGRRHWLLPTQRRANVFLLAAWLLLVREVASNGDANCGCNSTCELPVFFFSITHRYKRINTPTIFFISHSDVICELTPQRYGDFFSLARKTLLRMVPFCLVPFYALFISAKILVIMEIRNTWSW